MTIIEAAPVTNLEGGLIALGLAVASLLLRAWLTSPHRRFPRLILPSPQRPHAEGGVDEAAGRSRAARQASVNVPSAYNGRH